MNETVWDVIKRNYKNNLGIPEKVLDYIALRPIFICSLSGYSNNRIAKRFKEEEEYIENILHEFLRFSGWSTDLDFNPIAIYNLNNGNLKFFRQEIMSRSDVNSIKFIDKTFYLCRYFKNKIESEIEKYHV